MQTKTTADEISTTALWVGRILSALVILFLGMDSVMKFFRPAPVIAACTQLGLSPSLILPIGVLCLLCTLLYAIPGTALLGAVLLTGYLGGAVAINLRAGNPLLSHVLFPVYVGVAAWVAIYLRDGRLRRLLRNP